MLTTHAEVEWMSCWIFLAFSAPLLLLGMPSLACELLPPAPHPPQAVILVLEWNVFNIFGLGTRDFGLAFPIFF